MTRLVCAEVPYSVSRYLGRSGCEKIDLVVFAVALLVLGAAYVQRMQRRKMQRQRGGLRNGPAVKREDGKWDYSTYLTLPFVHDVYVRLREGYTPDDLVEDIPAMAQSFRRPLVGYAKAGFLMRTLGFPLRVYADRTLRRARYPRWRKLLDRVWRRTNRYGKGRLVVGLAEDSTKVILDVLAGPLGIIVGAPNSGKSSFLRVLIRQIVERIWGAKLWLWDAQNMYREEDYPRATILRGLPALRDHIAWLCEEKERREALLHSCRVGEWQELRGKNRLEPLFLVADEAHRFVDPAAASDSPKASAKRRLVAEIQDEDMLELLAREGRKVGIYVILASQIALQEEWFLHFTLASMFRLAFALPSRASSSSFLEGDSRAADQSLRAGRAILLDPNGTRLIRVFHAPYPRSASKKPEPSESEAELRAPAEPEGAQAARPAELQPLQDNGSEAPQLDILGVLRRQDDGE